MEFSLFSEKINSKNNTISIFFLLLFFVDFISKIIHGSSDPIFSFASVTKLLVEFVIIIYLFLNYKVVNKYLIVGLILLFMIFFLGNLFNKSQTGLFQRLLNNIKIFNWYIFIFILTLLFDVLRTKENYKSIVNQLFKTFLIVFVINSIGMIAGFIFDIHIFQSYSYGRFGYIGFIRNVSLASYIYMTFTSFFYLKYNHKKTKLNLFYLLASFFISLLIGTKAILLFNILFCIYFISLYSIKYLIYFLLIISISISLFFDFLFGYFKIYYPVLYSVYKENDVFTMLFSLRNISFSQNFIPYIKNNWTFINYLFGGAEFNKHRVEFEIVDFFWFFGIVGTIIFFYIINKCVIRFKSILEYKPIIIIIFITNLAGSFFSSVPVITFFYVLILYVKNLECNTNRKNKN